MTKNTRIGSIVAACVVASCALGCVASEVNSNFPFASEHRNVRPSNITSTNFYGSVTGIVDEAYVSARGGGTSPLLVTNIVTNVVTKAYVEGLGIDAGKRDLTNNVCVATTMGAPFGLWSTNNLPSGVTWDAQPYYDEGIDLWNWDYEGGSAMSEEGGANATTLTFMYDTGFTSTRTATPVALSNDVFTTYSFVTNAVANGVTTIKGNYAHNVTNMGETLIGLNYRVSLSGKIITNAVFASYSNVNLYGGLVNLKQALEFNCPTVYNELARFYNLFATQINVEDIDDIRIRYGGDFGMSIGLDEYLNGITNDTLTVAKSYVTGNALTNGGAKAYCDASTNALAITMTNELSALSYKRDMTNRNWCTVNKWEGKVIDDCIVAYTNIQWSSDAKLVGVWYQLNQTSYGNWVWWTYLTGEYDGERFDELFGVIQKPNRKNDDDYWWTKEEAENAPIGYFDGGASEFLGCTGLVNHVYAKFAIDTNVYTKAEADANAMKSITNAVTSGYLCTTAAADGKYLPLTGGTITGRLAQGTNCVATGKFAHAEGNQTQAIGDYSHAEGDRTIAYGQGSHAEGYITTATGIYSRVYGYKANANQPYSFTWSGDYGALKNYDAHTVGSFNINPMSGLSGFYVGATNMETHLQNHISPIAYVTNNVLAAGNEVKATFTNATTTASLRLMSKQDNKPQLGYTRTVSGVTEDYDYALPKRSGTIALTSAVNADSIDYITTLNTTVGQWENYWGGSNICWEVTNYYGQIDIPKLRLLELRDGAYREVWNDITKFNIFQTNMMADIVTFCNTNVQPKLDAKADKAWGKYTSAGEEAPSNMVWHTAPTTVFAGGYEYQRFAVGNGSIAVLTSKGAPTFTAGEEGKFRIGDEGGTNYFGFSKTDSYTIGVRTDGITVSGQKVTLEYDTVGSDYPIIYYCASLASPVWEQLNNADGTPISGATYTPTFVTHSTYISAEMNVGSAPSGFFKAETTVLGASIFETNMKANLMGGIMCTNTAAGAMGVIRPTFNGTTVIWNWSAQ